MRPINERFLGKGPGKIQVSRFRRREGVESNDPAYIVAQKGRTQFLISDIDDNWVERMTLVTSAEGELNPGEFKIESLGDDDVVKAVRKLYNRTVIQSDSNQASWNVDASFAFIDDPTNNTSDGIIVVDVLKSAEEVGQGGVFQSDPPVPAEPNAILFLSVNATASSVSDEYGRGPGLEQTTTAAQPSVSGSVATFATGDFWEPTFAGGATALSTTKLPEGASGAQAGEGLPGIGLDRLSSGQWAVANYGEPSLGAGSPQASSLCILSSDFSAIDAEYLMSDYTSVTGDAVQGVAVDASGNVWIANKTDRIILGIDPSDGTEIGRVSVGFDPNALGWDDGTGELIVGNQADNTLRWITTAGSQTASRAAPAGLDQISYDGSFGASGGLWMSFDGATTVQVYDIANATAAALPLTFAGCGQPEGIYYDRDTRTLYLLSDEGLKNTGDNENQVITYNVAPPVGPQFGLGWSGASAAANQGTSVILGYGAEEGTDIANVGLYQVDPATLRLILRHNLTNYPLSWTGIDITTDAEYWVEVDMTAGTHGQAELFINGASQGVQSYASAVPIDVFPAGDGLYVASGMNLTGDAPGRDWEGTVRGAAVAYEAGLRATVEARY